MAESSSSQPAGETLKPLPFMSPRWIHEVPRDQLGIKLPSRPMEDAQVDIVAVHGLGAIPAITWREKHSGVNWLEDEFMLPRHVPKARIMMFGYDSIYVGKNPVRTSVEAIANNLLESLQAQRRNNPDRPLVFIGHCFGGLVIERAILLSQLRSTPIVNATVGIVSLGTPHRGTETFSDQGQLMATIAGAVASSPEDDKLYIEPGVLSALKSMNGKLVEGSADFARLCIDKQIQVRCFFETRRSDIGRLVGRSDVKDFMVDEESAALDGQPSYALSVDHFSLNKYSGPDDGNYRAICDQLVQLYHHALLLRENKRNDSGKEPQLPTDDEIRFLESLYTSSYTEHKRRIDKRVGGTCQWFTEHEQFMAWNERSTSDLLWLSADPGCGKSVLAKYLIDEKLHDIGDRTVVYFFFKDDNEEQRSGINAISALIHQLLSAQPSLLTYATNKFKGQSKRLQASLEDIWSVLMSILAQNDAGEVLCILDALDECEESSRMRFIDYFLEFYDQINDRTNSPNLVKFLVTSRPYFGIERRFKRLTSVVPTIRLAAETETDKISQEINLVIDWRLSALKKILDLDEPVAMTLSRKLKSMEHRTYLWLRLIFDVIESSLEVTEKRLKQTIDSIPDTVYRAYAAILAKSPNPVKAKKALQIIVCAARPLAVRELNVALAIEDGFKTMSDLDLEPEQRFQNTLRQLCGLFVSVVDSKVYLFHQTAKEFLLASSLEDQPDTATSYVRFGLPIELKAANYLVAQKCILYLLSTDLLPILREYPTSPFEYLSDLKKDRLGCTYPFIDYAANHWDRHAKESDLNDADPLNKQILDLCTPRERSSKIWWQWRSSDNPPISPYAILMSRISKKINGRTALSDAARRGDISEVQALLELGMDPDIKDSDGQTPVSIAASLGYTDITQLLIGHGADTRSLPKDLGTGHMSNAIRLGIYLASNGFSGIAREIMRRG